MHDRPDHDPLLDEICSLKGKKILPGHKSVWQTKSILIRYPITLWYRPGRATHLSKIIIIRRRPRIPIYFLIHPFGRKNLNFHQKIDI